MLVIPGVELTQNLERCEPPPPPGLSCLLHVNALFVTPPPGGAVPWAPAAGIDRAGRYRRALAATRALGGIAQLNHPNFDYSADARLVTQMASEGVTLLEIANQAWDSNNDPQDGHPSTEAIWDAALSAGGKVFGTATDDAHHYDDAAAAGARDEPVFVGDLGFVMVRARKDPDAIRQALVKGDFYASTGVILKRIDRGPATLEIEVAERDLPPGRRGRRLRARRGQGQPGPQGLDPAAVLTCASPLVVQATSETGYPGAGFSCFRPCSRGVACACRTPWPSR
jgi:hypothetical protein